MIHYLICTADSFMGIKRDEKFCTQKGCVFCLYRQLWGSSVDTSNLVKYVLVCLFLCVHVRGLPLIGTIPNMTLEEIL